MNVNLLDKDSVLKAQGETLNLLTVAKKKLAGRKPKLKEAERELAAKKAEAVRKVEEAFNKRNAKLLSEVSELEKQVSNLSKRYLEFANDIVRLTETPFPTPVKSTKSETALAETV